ncbi:hypothetical protein GLOIN_2v1796089 [Rhizophagus clarus]|uniref:Uncharacterized protein n=1 Tax=Rhizophagus clarus TaxID=94130 RepID=A0A8H3LKN3_9GLOM|nr:hypothetical protein GLOIN_2v1796089 [Rhizophagus clarus]
MFISRGVHRFPFSRRSSYFPPWQSLGSFHVAESQALAQILFIRFDSLCCKNQTFILMETLLPFTLISDDDHPDDRLTRFIWITTSGPAASFHLRLIPFQWYYGDKDPSKKQFLVASKFENEITPITP